MKTNSLKALRKRLSRGIRTAAEGGAVAYQLVAARRSGEITEAQLRELRSEFLRILEQAGLMNLASRQVAYAARLARYPGELLYEEMHKLFSLSDEVESMLELDMSLTLDEKQDWLSAIRERLEREPEKARLVAEDTAKGWNADWWWHSTLPAQARR